MLETNLHSNDKESDDSLNLHINCVYWYSDLICTGYDDGHVQILDFKSNTICAHITCNAHHSGVLSILPFKDENNLLIGTKDGQVKIWDVRSLNKPIKEFHVGKQMTCFTLNTMNHLYFGDEEGFVNYLCI